MSDGIGDWTRRLRKEPPTAVEYVTAIDAEALDTELGWAAEHARRYIATNGEDDGWQGPRPILLLYANGRRSGRVRRNPLLFWEHLGERYVVASKGGDDTPPSWYLNIVDHPRVHVRVMAEVYAATAVVLDDDERATLWPLLTAHHTMFEDYQARTQRQIPLIRLVPDGTAGEHHADSGAR